MTDPKLFKDVWHRYTAFAEQFNEPGRFTALIAYEWTSNYGGGNNLHRNVIYRDGRDKANRVLPLTTFQTENPEELWRWMESYEEKTGGNVLAIPHNGNLSNGLMFAVETFDGKPLTKEGAQTRMKWERLYEVTQGKGTSEQHPSLSPNDEFANFEIWDKGNLNVVPKKPGMLSFEYAREAFKHGLEVEQEVGGNPFKFGLAGSTDTHNSLTAAEENNFFGKFPSSEPSPERWNEDAFNFTQDDAFSRQPAEAGYAKGVPMGGEMTGAPNGKSPTFLVAALKDSLSGNLDRIQIVKGWLDKNGKAQERIYNVAWGDRERRKPDSKGNLPPVGNTVNVQKATWTNTIGDPELIAVWADPDFDPSTPAFYYARVLEIPTPRWNVYDAVYFGIKIGPEVPVSIQERAYTSPIWYNPQGS